MKRGCTAIGRNWSSRVTGEIDVVSVDINKDQLKIKYTLYIIIYVTLLDSLIHTGSPAIYSFRNGTGL